MTNKTWEDMIDEQAIAFSMLCMQNERLAELAEKADDGYNFMSEAEQDEMFGLMEDVYDNPFFAPRRVRDWEELEE